MPTPLPRGTCATCGRDVACQPPKGGDGSLLLTRRHFNADNERCPGSRTTPADFLAVPEHGAGTGEPIARATAGADLTAPAPADPAPQVPAGGARIGDDLPGHLTPHDYIDLPEHLTGGLTIYGRSAAVQVRPAHCAQDSTVAVLSIADDCTVVDDLYLLDAETARAIRDVLNIATARGIL